MVFQSISLPRNKREPLSPAEGKLLLDYFYSIRCDECSTGHSDEAGSFLVNSPLIKIFFKLFQPTSFFYVTSK